MSYALATDFDNSDFIELSVTDKRLLTPHICLIELRREDAAPLPPFTPGAHLTVATPAGARRSYSLTNDSRERDRYVLAIKREAGGRRGSRSMVDDLAVGMQVPVMAPVNTFELCAAPRYLLLAGGIGITPILAMARALVARADADFELVYCTRDPEQTAFLDVLGAPPFAAHLTLHHDHGDPARGFDFWPLLEKPRRATHVYCCGPAALMEEVRDMSGHWPGGQVHFEDFAGVQAVRPDDSAFRVRHLGSDRVFEIPAGRSILEVLREHTQTVPSSCESGTCGTCKCQLLAGEVEHRDLVLSEADRQHNIMICVSRAAQPGAELLIDY